MRSATDKPRCADRSCNGRYGHCIRQTDESTIAKQAMGDNWMEETHCRKHSWQLTALFARERTLEELSPTGNEALPGRIFVALATLHTMSMNS